MSDLIRRRDAISLPVMPKEHRKYQTQNLDDAYEQGWFDLQKCIEDLPTAQPYTEAEIQTMQDLEQAEIDKAFELGKEEGRKEAQPKTGKWINGHWDGDSNFRIDGRGNCWFVRECSNCHEEIQGKPTRYCPHCGCRMEGEQNG